MASQPILLLKVKAFTWAVNGWKFGLYLGLSEMLGGGLRAREIKFSWEMPSPGQRSYFGPVGVGGGHLWAERDRYTARPQMKGKRWGEEGSGKNRDWD